MSYLEDLKKADALVDSALKQLEQVAGELKFRNRKNPLDPLKKFVPEEEKNQKIGAKDTAYRNLQKDLVSLKKQLKILRFDSRLATSDLSDSNVTHVIDEGMSILSTKPEVVRGLRETFRIQNALKNIKHDLNLEIDRLEWD